MDTLKYFLSNKLRHRKYEAYVALISEFSLLEVAQHISAGLGIKLHQSGDFDEYEAYGGNLGDHDFTILLPPYAQAAGEKQFEILVEPGASCEGAGESINISSELLVSLQEKCSILGQFKTLE